MRLKELFYIIKSDLYRYAGQTQLIPLAISVLLTPGAKYTFFLRIARYLKTKGRFAVPFYIVTRLLLHHYNYKFGISIPYNTEIEPGFYIGHFGGIVVNSEARIGKNCNINHGVTIGTTYEGKHPGNPRLMNNVYLGPGCKVIGGITIGNNVLIGANCVVTKSIPDNGVVVGVPGKVISFKGSKHYVVNRLDWKNCKNKKSVSVKEVVL